MIDLSKKAQVGKKITTKKLIKKIDSACSEGILRIDGGRSWDNPPCKGFICNNHLIRRGCHKVRFHPLNCFAGTSGANYRHENHPEYMIAWFVHKFGAKVFYELQSYSVGEAKWRREELERLLEFWTEICEMDETPSREWVTAMYMSLFRPQGQIDIVNAYSECCGNREKKQ